MSKNKVFVGPGNIAGNAMHVAKSLRVVGINAKSFSYNSHPFGYPCDHDNILFVNPFKSRNFYQKITVNKYTLNIIWTTQKIALFTWAVLRFDTFIFISHETFFKNNCDIGLLKFLNKKVIFLFVGCPERDPKDLINLKDGGYCSFCKDIVLQKSLHCFDEKKRNKIKYLSNKADIIFTQKDTISFISDKSKVRPFFCISDSQISKEDIIKKFTNVKLPIITHLPSNKLLKGTSIVKKSIETLSKQNYQFQYLSEFVTNNEVETILKKTHILIDQFSVGNGLLAVEGMSYGCVVICRTSSWFKKDFPELPFISCELNELNDVLKDLIVNNEKMLGIALKSFEYYKKFHSSEVVGNYYKKTLNLT